MPNIKIKLPKKTLKVLIAAIIPTLVILASYFSIFETFELATLDLRFKIRNKICPPSKLSDKVVIIEIAQDTLDQIGKWPINRDYHAVLIDALTLYKVESIVFDVLFSQESPSDVPIIESLANSDRVYLATAFLLSKDKQKGIFPEAVLSESPPLPVLKEKARGIGHINMIPDRDGTRRSMPLFLDFKGRLIPQLSFLALCDHLGVSIEDIKVKKGHYIQVSSDLSIPIDSKGNTMVNFTACWDEPFPFKHYSFIDILKAYVAAERGRTPALDLNELRDKICLIGLTAAGTHDLNPIPLQKRYPMIGMHASLLNTILTRSFITRADPIVNLLILALLSLAMILAVLKLKPNMGILFALVIFFGFVTIAFALFGLFNIWIDLFYPLLLVSAVYLFCTFYRYITELHKRMMMEKELSIAQRIQQSFLKEASPQREGLDIGVIMTPAKSVGGDLYDFVEFKDSNVLGIMLGDVSGKGMPAALFMAKTVSDFRFHAKAEEDSLKAVTDLNNQISVESTSGLFVTMCYIVVDLTAKKLSIVDGGHLPVVHGSKDKEISLITATGGMAIGIMDGVEFEKQEVPTNPGDVFVIYSDGVTEARNIKKEEFGEDALKEAVSKYKELNAKDITQKIYDDLMKFRGKAPQHDDITIITIKTL